jgi:hypothetical protein
VGFSIIYHNGSDTSIKLTLRLRPGVRVGRRPVLPEDCLTSLDVLTNDEVFAESLIDKIKTAFNSQLVKLKKSH